MLARSPLMWLQALVVQFEQQYGRTDFVATVGDNNYWEGSCNSMHTNVAPYSRCLRPLAALTHLGLPAATFKALHRAARTQVGGRGGERRRDRDSSLRSAITTGRLTSRGRCG